MYEARACGQSAISKHEGMPISGAMATGVQDSGKLHLVTGSRAQQGRWLLAVGGHSLPAVKKASDFWAFSKGGEGGRFIYWPTVRTWPFPTR